jgi:hypothetical protein
MLFSDFLTTFLTTRLNYPLYAAPSRKKTRRFISFAAV